jgi:predicted cupin superfamily sugar epimerase
MTAKQYVDLLQMNPHPEGGFYKECFRSKEELNFYGFEGTRSLSTSIYFLLEQGQTSSLHRIKSDEIWYFHDGQTLEIIELDESGNELITRLGQNILDGDVLQHVVSAGRWFGARPSEGASFCLVGCQVSPGFDFKDFELK